MNFVETALPGVLIVEPRVFGDDRGFFMEVYHAARFTEAGIGDSFVQDNHSRSSRGVLRGLHYQQPNPQGKLVRAVCGTIFDVAVDIRRGSPHFGRWVGVELSEENKRQLWVPPGFAHGFCVTSESADVVYKCTALYEPANDRGIRWNDPEIGIAWPPVEPLLSTKDTAAPMLRDAAILPVFMG
ncbi:MAG: dTDP-4-dehydrorhamnose 3,5-epimerase [Thermoanaerobaculia bacterium]|nr:dTDP-4-dehydrorhamnose 3,5-epimerase [Thermoanaerobaculia bacterium]